ncbi:nucleotide exchange factor SIL1 isoform X1 [Momordica charantia]|uniref:Nucleotide exchange factor SIL1 isoform X1 n=1 Tax=Momordica charantia TaxID=3673 RepID=A0A6J1D5A9_MOMCH|nr:nucleotide exchange factor SIL1 isoform X1 [Momordica charantia]
MEIKLATDLFNLEVQKRKYMGRCLVAGLCFWLSLTLVIAEDTANTNKSSLGGLIWSSAKEEGDLLVENRPQEDSTAATAVVHDPDGFDGGFYSLDSMLQWAIGHSDPAKLKGTAQDVKQLSPSALKKRQEEIKDLMEKLKMPSDAKLIQIAIDDLKNSSLSLEDHHRALQELLVLVEPIDNANDLNKLGGIAVLIHELNHIDPNARKVAAWILGKASQNNPIVQKQVLELGALAKLVTMVKSDFVEEAIKALYAISALIRNNLSGQELFYAESGDSLLQDILSNSSMDIRLKKKAVFLTSDLAETQLEKADEAEMPFLGDRLFLKSVVDLTHSTDIDLQEKALVALKNLLLLRTTEAQVLREFCGLDVALQRMRVKLEVLMEEEDHRDYAMDVESLRSQVELIFLEKLGKSMQVPT